MTPPAFLLDLDGTLYVGDAALPGAAETLRALRARRTPFRLVTNTTSRSRAMLVERLRRCGIDAAPEEIFSAPMAAAALARDRGHTVVAPFLAAPALEDLEGLELAGGTAAGAASGARGTHAGAPGELATAVRGARPTAVIVGDLGELWSYALMQEAFTYLLDGAELIACSRDRYFRRADGLALDAGPFVVGLEYATGKTALIAGKPGAAFFHAAATQLGITGNERRRIAVVGDDLWTDVAGGQGAGMQGWLVRTGKFRADALAASGIAPDRVLDSVAALLSP